MATEPEAGAKQEESRAPEIKDESKGHDEIDSPHQEPDWKDLLRIEREAREKAERDRDNYKTGLLSRRRQEKAQKAEEGEEESDDLEAKIAQGVQKAMEPLVSVITGNKLETTLNALIPTDASKRDLVKFYYENRIQRTGTSDEAIRQDLETALAIADSKRISKENEELKRMKDNNVYVPPAGGGSGDRGGAPERKAYQWTSEQEAALEARARSVGIADVEKYKERAWQQLQSGTAFAVQPKPKK